MVIMPVIVPYFQSIGLSMKNVFELQSIFSFLVLIFEVPSGYISDLLGRKRTLIAASILHGIGYTIFPFAIGFWSLVIAEVFLALALCLYSGTDISLLYDSLNENEVNKEASQVKVVGQQIFYKQSGEALAALLCSFLMVQYSLKLPVIFQAIFSWLPLFVAVTLVEPLRPKMDKSKHKENFIYIYKVLFKDSKILSAIIYNMMMYGVATLLAVWLFQNYWKDLDIDIFYFGLIWAALNFTVGITGKIAHKIEQLIGSTKVILLIGILPIMGYFGMGINLGNMGIIFCFCFQISRGLNQVILKDALNKRITGDLRATANSVTSLGVRLIFITLGPLLGHIIDIKGPNLAYYFMGTLYIFIFLFILIPFLKHRSLFKTSSL